MFFFRVGQNNRQELNIGYIRGYKRFVKADFPKSSKHAILLIFHLVEYKYSKYFATQQTNL